MSKRSACLKGLRNTSGNSVPKVNKGDRVPPALPVAAKVHYDLHSFVMANLGKGTILSLTE